MPSSLLQHKLAFKLVTTNKEQAVRAQLVRRLVTTYLQTCKNLCVFTRVDYEENTKQTFTEVNSHFLKFILYKFTTKK